MPGILSPENAERTNLYLRKMVECGKLKQYLGSLIKRETPENVGKVFGRLKTLALLSDVDVEDIQKALNSH